MNTATNNLDHNATVPTTIGALLTEENIIDPLSHLPSFLELTFVDVARNSGRVALSAAWDVGVVYLKGLEDRLATLEQMMVFKVANHRLQRGGSSSSLVSAKRIVMAAMSRLRLFYYTHLRKTCYVIIRGLQSLAPELQSLVMFAIDYHCIHYLAGSTGCEMVYGLKRSKIVNSRVPNLLEKKRVVAGTSMIQKNVVDLTAADKTKSAVLAALIPYWKERCDKLYSNLTEQPSTNEIDNTNFNRSSNTRLRDLFTKLYPYIHLTHEGSIFLYQFAYLLEYTPYWSFSLHALGIILRRLTVADVQRKDEHRDQQKATNNQTLLKPQSQRAQRYGAPINSKQVSKLTIPNILRGALVFSISYTIVYGWCRYFQRQLSLRRRRWIAGDNNSSQIRQQSNASRNDEATGTQRIHHPIPPPPLPPVQLKGTENSDCKIKWACPWCHEPRINPTASTSGYVFCYKCLLLKLRRDGEYCPVTGMPCKESQVVRLFESNVPGSNGVSPVS
jgi:peroxin-12